MTGICCCIASRSQRFIRGVRVRSHELVVDDIITRVNLAMSLALIVIPDPRASSWKHRLDAQEVFHLAGLEDSAQPSERVGFLIGQVGSQRRPLDVAVTIAITMMIVLTTGYHDDDRDDDGYDGDRDNDRDVGSDRDRDDDRDVGSDRDSDHEDDREHDQSEQRIS
jgi:hypothetical protein